MKPAKKTPEIFLWPPPKRVERTRGVQRIPRAGPKICACIRPHLAREAYELEITTRYSSIVAGSALALAHALQTLNQLYKHGGGTIPCARIVDAPDFPIRGFMLDISRGKVPTMAAFRALFDLLATLKFNHLQLYTEHTFAFRSHQKIWSDASPLTAKEIGQLQALGRQRHIELSANFNSFGHFERWLKHPEYKHLAECPNGFVHPLKGRVLHGTTLRPNAASLKFLDKLWAEYLPLFKSKRFNLGGDEPWELGLGWSKPLVKKYGKHRVYLDFLKKLHQQAAKHGKEILFWGDILLESPELVKEVPKDATALLWGYEANHPFAEQCAKLAKAKRKFWVCPGTSAWNTFTGRTDNMLVNIESAAKHGLANGAEGLLLTSWGDNGNHQPWPLMYPGLVYAAGMAWNAKGTKRTDLARAVNQVIFENRGVALAKCLIKAGQIEATLNGGLHNASRLHRWFFAPTTQVKSEAAKYSPKVLTGIEVKLAKLVGQLDKKAPAPGENFYSRQELILGLRMAIWSVRRAQLIHAESGTLALKMGLRTLIEEFEKLWVLHTRARPGGLAESVARMRAVEKEL